MGLFDLFKKKKPGQEGSGEAPLQVEDSLEPDSPAGGAALISSEPAEALATAPPIPEPSAVASEIAAGEAAPPQAAPPQAAPPQAGVSAAGQDSPAAGTAPAPRSRFRAALNRTRAFLASTFSFDSSANVSEDYYDSIVEGLVLADVGTTLSSMIVHKVKTEMASRGLIRQSEAQPVLSEVLGRVMTEGVKPVTPIQPGKLAVLMMVGVNGSGKTTLTAKLAQRLKSEGRRVLLCAADTFRAAAVDQLRVWAERIGVDIVAGQEGADPASVVFDACQAAQSRNMDVLIVDTAGRLQNKSNLMAELEKVARTVEKATPGANIVHILVLDSTVGQNALSQAEVFNECCNLSGLALTKMDGTAKGGAVIGVVARLRLPVLYVGVGESADDLLDFDVKEFISGLLPEGAVA